MLRKVSAQVVKSCTAHILSAGQLWERPRPGLVADLTACYQLHDAYLAQYRWARISTQHTLGRACSQAAQAAATCTAPETQ